MTIGKILTFARKTGIQFLDTAVSYRTCEQKLGSMNMNGWSLVTKIPKVPPHTEGSKWVFQHVFSSIRKLNQPKLYGVLLHSVEDLRRRDAPKMVDCLRALKKQGLMEKVGVSIYCPSDLEFVLDVFLADIVQAPMNLFDRRLEVSGWLEKLHRKKIEIHARSVFLQGLLLMPLEKIPKHFHPYFPLFEAFWNACKREKVAPLAACLNYPLSKSEVTKVLVGVETLPQIKQIVQNAQKPNQSQDWHWLGSSDERLINPVLWKTR